MAMRNGRVARTPVSERDPNALTTPATRTTNREVTGGRERASREEIARMAAPLLDGQATDQQHFRFHRGLTRVLDWLETFPGEDWQDRWLLSGSDEHGTGWGPAGLTPGQRQNL